MTFPTASSQVYYNEDGEVTGWDSPSYYEPDYDPYYMGGDDDEVDPEDCTHDDHSWSGDFAATGACDMCGSSLNYTAWEDETGAPTAWELQ